MAQLRSGLTICWLNTSIRLYDAYQRAGNNSQWGGGASLAQSGADTAADTSSQLSAGGFRLISLPSPVSSRFGRAIRLNNPGTASSLRLLIVKNQTALPRGPAPACSNHAWAGDNAHQPGKTFSGERGPTRHPTPAPSASSYPVSARASGELRGAWRYRLPDVAGGGVRGAA